MAEHLSERDIERYRQRALPPAELLAADRHLAACDRCHQRLNEGREYVRQAHEALAGDGTANPPPGSDHLSYEQLTALVDGDRDDVDREIATVHLAACPQCAAEMEDLEQLKASLPPATPQQPASTRVQQVLQVRAVRAVAAWPRLAAAAGVVVAVGALTWGWRILREPQDGAGAPGVGATAPTVPPGQLPPARSPRIVVLLRDGGGDLTLDEDGNLGGPGALASGPIGEAVKSALQTQRLNIAPALEGVRGAPGVLMGESSQGDSFGPTTPVGTAVLSDRPTFRWRPLAGASMYVVTVYDTRFTPVARSQPQTTTEWTVSSPLRRGAIYVWQVTAIKDGVEMKSPVTPAPEARFRVLGSEQAAEVERAAKAYATSHLVIGTVYANAGLLADAEREFRIVLSANPDSAVAQALLRDVTAAAARR